MLTPRSHRCLAVIALTAVLTTSCDLLGEEVAVKPAAPDATSGGIVRIGISEPLSVDPGEANDPAGLLITSLICEPLLQLDPATGELKPGIIQSWAISDNVITMRVRKDVHFNDGTLLEARDIAFSLSRVARQDYASPLAESLSRVVGYDELHGEADADVDANATSRKLLLGISAFSDTGLSIALEEPDPEFLRQLAAPVASPLSQEAVESDPEGVVARPVCAGPYELDEPFTRGQRVIRVARVDGFYAAGAGSTRGGAGYPDAFEFHVFPDADAQVAAFDKGEIDLAHTDPADSAALRARPDGTYLTVPTPIVEYVGIPSGQPLLQEPDVRTALSRALDRTRLVEEVFAGGRLPASGFLPPTVRSQQPLGCGPDVPVEGDVAAALELLGDTAESLRGLQVRLYFNDEFRNGALAGAVAKQWQAAFGLQIELRPLPWPEYLSMGQGTAGFDGFYRLAHTSPYSELGGFLIPLFDSSSPDNISRYDSDSLDRSLLKARQENVDGEWQSRYAQAEQELCAQLPMIPVTFGQDEYLVRSDRVGSAVDAYFDRTTGRPALRELFVRSAADGGPANS